MANTYSYSNRKRIVFAEDDIALALDVLPKSDRYKTVATLNMDYVSGGALKHYADVATSLGGIVKSEYNNLNIVVAKDREELREAAEHALRYNDQHAVLRDLRAAEQGIEPEPEKD